MRKSMLLPVVAAALAATVLAQDGGIIWAGRTQIPDRKAGNAPAMAVLDGTIHLVYRGKSKNQLYHCTFDGQRWSPESVIPDAISESTPALVVKGTTLHLIHRGARHSDFFHLRYDGGFWKPATPIPDRKSRAAPALAYVGDTLHMVYVGRKSDHLYHSTLEGGRWSAEARLAGIESAARPALAVYNGTLYLACIGKREDRGAPGHTVYVLNWDGRAWSAPRLIPGVRSSDSPSMVVYGSRLLMFVTGTKGQYRWTAFDGNSWTLPSEIAGQAGSGSVAVVRTDVPKPVLHLAYRDRNKHYLWYAVGNSR